MNDLGKSRFLLAVIFCSFLAFGTPVHAGGTDGAGLSSGNAGRFTLVDSH